MAAARELAEAWVAEKRSRGESVPLETTALLGHVDLPDAGLLVGEVEDLAATFSRPWGGEEG